MTPEIDPDPQLAALAAVETEVPVDSASDEEDTYNPYENELIGQFLMALGYAARHAGKPRIHVALLQQTPQDKFYGDLLFGCTAYHAIEFKRSESASDLRKERRKWNLRGLRKHVRELVMRTRGIGHWMVFGSADGRDVLFAKYMPRLLRWLKVSRGTPPADELVRILVEGNSGFATPEELKDYLEGIALFRKKVSRSGTGGMDAKFLGVGTDADGGIVLFNAEILKYEIQHKLTPPAQRPPPPQPQAPQPAPPPPRPRPRPRPRPKRG